MLRNLLKKYFLLFLLTTICYCSLGQQKQYSVYPIAFYNVENLFDTERDSSIQDEEFTPDGGMNWTPDKYWKKLEKIASVLSSIGRKYGKSGPAIIGLSEIENRRVLNDLIMQNEIAGNQYEIVHYESPDRRGIDVAMLYNPKLFRLIDAQVLPYKLASKPSYVTRDVLMVKGVMANEMVHIFVNHWPSRFGSKSSELREHAAGIVKNAVDSIYLKNPQAKIIIMGDLNDDPVDVSVKDVLGAKRRSENLKTGDLYNTMYKHYVQGIGSLGYLAKWSLFDQIIISEALLGDDRSSLKFWKSEIYNPDYLITKDGRYKGYPLRTFSGNLFQNGYSDHFPVLIYLLKELN
ncbi:endonuclease [Sphingobacterium mizutaii NBRC 14946 = DSM 11724]|uniref:Endonuclease/Exonuclease/phosphatase family n=2 Tax=Sphingobacterium mizutaii TaxID=1010 RepID=A0AAJ5BZL2_9SPHI|nr:endonuclease [Sphingobacterium mizutaii]GEM67524.1 endonuclease [Sphingobacterium mizutaii NBRC 14946 = DSM 11724]SDL40467.1 Endonuclease/Exonuclease/phosphatase family protein [Sphingobacterium mizutaii]SNV44417.1 Endonuclease/Exonuclease/phosphatase family [Sphingobacterium mizutaii]